MQLLYAILYADMYTSYEMVKVSFPPIRGVYYMHGNLKLELLTMHGSLGGENCSN